MSSIGPDFPAAVSLTSPSRMQASTFSQDTASQPFAALLDATTSAPAESACAGNPIPARAFAKPANGCAEPTRPACASGAAAAGTSERFDGKLRHDRHESNQTSGAQIRKLKSACRRQRQREQSCRRKRERWWHCDRDCRCRAWHRTARRGQGQRGRERENGCKRRGGRGRKRDHDCPARRFER